ncbi:chain length determinant protein EpsF [Chitiniphilus shinanonensis]|uniref:chain length determinant protein EpsF n=1 Tax=Chitiniphilus shinanonensis TaxID=553088 RepID=UPI0030339847
MNLQQFLLILRARLWLALMVFGLVVVGAVVVSLLLPKQYTGEVVLTVDAKPVDPINGLAAPNVMAPDYMATQAQIITSHNTALNVVDALGLDKLPETREAFVADTEGHGNIRDWLARSLLRSLEVEPARDSRIISLRFTAADPQFASAIANAFAQAYVKTVSDIRTNAAQQNSVFFEAQLKTLQKNLETAQRRYSDYQREQGIVASDERLDTETQRLNDLSSQVVMAQSQAYDARSRARGDNAPDVLNNPLIQQLKSQLAAQQAKFDELAQKVGPNHPHYVAAKAELDATRNELNELTRQYATGLSSAASSSAARQASLASALAQQKERVLKLKGDRTELEVLQRQVENAQRAYDTTLDRYSQSMLESRAAATNISVLQAAPIPLKPSSPRLLLNLALAIFTGGLLGIGCALVAELLDRRVRSARDIEHALDLPVLAELSLAPTPQRKSSRRWFRGRRPDHPSALQPA